MSEDVRQKEAVFVELQHLVEELAATVHDLAKQVEALAILAEQQTELRDFPREISVIVSRASDLHRRAAKLVASASPQRQTAR
jgi:uncharacterized protein YoxC